MENLFDRLRSSVPAPSKEKLQQLEQTYTVPTVSSMPTKDLVAKWQANETPEYTSEVLKRMTPTINSAITSYASSLGEGARIKAAKLTLDALRTYKPEYGTDPSTHVFHNLKRLSRISGQRTSIIPLPEARIRELKLLEEKRIKFEDENGREPTIEQLADMTGFNTRKVYKLLDSNTVINDTMSESDESHDSMLTNKDITDDDYFEYVYASSNDVDKKIMEWSSGLHNKPVLSNNQIAAKLHMSAAAISQRKNKLQQKMSEVRSYI